jgi:hypothetical protein
MHPDLLNDSGEGRSGRWLIFLLNPRRGLSFLSMEGRIAGLEEDMRGHGLSSLKSEVVADISGLRSEMTLKLVDLPTKAYMWGILGGLTTAYGAELARWRPSSRGQVRP